MRYNIVGFRNLSGKEVVIPAKAVICEAEMVNMIPKLNATDRLISTDTNQEENCYWILDKLYLRGLSQWTEEQQQVAKDPLCK